MYLLLSMLYVHTSILDPKVGRSTIPFSSVFLLVPKFNGLALACHANGKPAQGGEASAASAWLVPVRVSRPIGSYVASIHQTRHDISCFHQTCPRNCQLTTKPMAICVPACVVSTSLPGRTATLKSSLPCSAFHSVRIVLRMMDFVVAVRACVFVFHSLTVGIAEDFLYKLTFILLLRARR